MKTRTGKVEAGARQARGVAEGGDLSSPAPGVPYLSVTRSNAAVVVCWPKANPNWEPVFTTNLVAVVTNTWTLISPPYQTNATDCVVTEPAPTGSKFCRLHRP